jgi:glycosyltransferase involved in cell wall biosynthesis
MRATVYHLHDPELLLVALALRLARRTVIFDSHEDHVAAMSYRDYLGVGARQIAAVVVELVQRIVLPRLNAIVAATPAIAVLMRKYNSRVVLVQNFPPIEEVVLPVRAEEETREDAVVYVGAISYERGIQHMIEAVDLVAKSRPCRLLLAGDFSDRLLEECMKRLPGWENVEFHGRVDREMVQVLFRRARAGIIVSHPNPNYVVSYATKMFEYFSAGIPAIASDFPIWRPIFEAHRCGVQVNPMDTSELARAIEAVLADPEGAAAMGARGRAAVLKEFNWGPQASSLLSLYHNVASMRDATTLGREPVDVSGRD